MNSYVPCKICWAKIPASGQKRHFQQCHPDEIHVQHVNKKARLVHGEAESKTDQFQPLDPIASEDGKIVEFGGNGFGESEDGEYGGFEGGEYGGFDGGFEAEVQGDRSGESGLGESNVGEREQGKSPVSSTGAAVRVQQFPGAGTST
jgi:hypothetical protein